MIGKHCATCIFSDVVGYDTGYFDYYTCWNRESGHFGHVLLSVHICDLWQDKWSIVGRQSTDEAMLVENEKDNSTLFKG